MKKRLMTYLAVLVVVAVSALSARDLIIARANAALTAYGLPGIYNQTPLSLSNGDGAALALDSSGRLLVSSQSFANGLSVGNGTVTTTIEATRFVFASSTTNQLGLLNVDASGNISTSGSIQIPNKFIVDTSGNLATSGTIHSYSNITVDNNLQVSGVITMKVGGNAGSLGLQVNSNSTGLYSSSDGAYFYGVSQGEEDWSIRRAAWSNSTFNVRPGSAAIPGLGFVLAGAQTGLFGISTTGIGFSLSGVIGASLTSDGGLNVLNGTTTSTLSKDYFKLSANATNASGTFYVDSTGNVDASGTIRQGRASINSSSTLPNAASGGLLIVYSTSTLTRPPTFISMTCAFAATGVTSVGQMVGSIGNQSSIEINNVGDSVSQNSIIIGDTGNGQAIGTINSLQTTSTNISFTNIDVINRGQKMNCQGWAE